MKKKKILFLMTALFLLLCACFLGACSKENAVMQPNDSTQPSIGTESNHGVQPDDSTTPSNSLEPDNSAADKNISSSESASPELKPDENETQTDTDEPLTWQSAYLEIICHMEDYLKPYLVRYFIPFSEDIFIDYREDPDFNPDHKEGYVGIHDFDGDGIPELLTGDLYEIGVFTFADGKIKKLVDLYWPDIVWGINGVYFKDNSINLECSGSTGSWNVCFGFVAGEYHLGRYYHYAVNPELTGDLITDVTLNGEPCTREEMDQIYNTYWSEHDYEAEYKERVKIINKDGTWVLQDWWSKEEMALDKDFDFELIRW